LSKPRHQIRETVVLRLSTSERPASQPAPALDKDELNDEPAPVIPAGCHMTVPAGKVLPYMKSLLRVGFPPICGLGRHPCVIITICFISLKVHLLFPCIQTTLAA